jgi:hypothetical protein
MATASFARIDSVSAGTLTWPTPPQSQGENQSFMFLSSTLASSPNLEPMEQDFGTMRRQSVCHTTSACSPGRLASSY